MPASLSFLYHDDLDACGIAYLSTGSKLKDARIITPGRSTTTGLSTSPGQLGSWLWYSLLGGPRPSDTAYHAASSQFNADHTWGASSSPSDRARAETLTAIFQAGLTPDLSVVTTRCAQASSLISTMHSLGELGLSG